MLAGANIRKNKGQAVLLTSLLLIASTLLIAGLSVLLGFGTYFDQTVEDLNTSDVRIIVSERYFNDEAEQLLRDDTSELQVVRGLIFTAEFYWGDSFISEGLLVYDINDQRDLSEWKLVDGELNRNGDAIYLPNVFRTDAGYEIDDTITFDFVPDTTRTFTVAGYIENIYSGGMVGAHTVFVNTKTFEDLLEDHQESKVSVIYANDLESFAEIELRLLETMPELGGAGPFTAFGILDLELMTNARTEMAGMVSMMTTIVAFIIVGVSLLVVRFTIVNSIEDNISNIGSLQAVGYTNGQILLSFVLQYGLIVVTAVLASILPAYALLFPIGDVLSGQSGLIWQPSIDLSTSLFAGSILVAIVLFVASLASRKVRKVTPVQALRDGSSTRSFKRNPFALDKTGMPLNLALSMKTVFQGIRQSSMMTFILITLSFTATIAVILFYNSAINISTFEQIPGIERSDAALAFMPDEDMGALATEISNHEDVYFAQFFASERIVVDDIMVTAFGMDDYSYRVTNNIYQGYFPENEEGITLSVLLANELEKEIGDQIVIGDDNASFEVVGIAQGMEGGSFFAYLTTEGKRVINPDYDPIMLHIYLHPEADSAAFVEELEDLYGDQTFLIVDMAEIFAVGAGSFAAIFAAVGAAILVSAAAIVILVLYFVIASSIVRRSRELGIQKAIGFTTKDLMSQISMAFVLPIVVGVITGSILGALALNPLMGAAMSEMGVMTANFIVNIAWVVGASVALLILAYAISMLVTWRIRKISAYSLVTE